MIIQECDVCKIKSLTSRVLVTYNISCECHGSNHTDIIHTCRDCSNKVPPTTFIKLPDIVGFSKISTKYLDYSLELLTVK